MGAWVARTVEEAAGSATLVGSPEFSPPLGYPAIPDLHPGEGPLGGILTALGNTLSTWNLVTACDMPGLTADFLSGLLDAAERSEADILAPRDSSGRVEPLCAVYHRRSRPKLEAAFAQGVRKVTGAFTELKTVWLDAPEPMPFQNVNTPEEWAAYGSQ